MLTLGFAIGLLVNVLLAFGSRGKGLLKVSLLLIGGFALSEVASVVLSPPSRIAVYAVLDSLGFMLTLIVITSHKSTQSLRLPFTVTYGCMILLHTLVLSHVRIPAYTYYAALNILTAVQVISCAVAGGRACVGLVRESADNVRLPRVLRLRARTDRFS